MVIRLKSVQNTVFSMNYYQKKLLIFIRTHAYFTYTILSYTHGYQLALRVNTFVKSLIMPI